MELEISRDDLALLDMLLSKAENETRIEIHHCRTREFKDYLKKREGQIDHLLMGVKKTLASLDRPDYNVIGTSCEVTCHEEESGMTRCASVI
jgi:hypothetical protein